MIICIDSKIRGAPTELRYHNNTLYILLGNQYRPVLLHMHDHIHG